MRIEAKTIDVRRLHEEFGLVGELRVRSNQVWVVLGGASLVGLVAMANWSGSEAIDPWPFKIDEVTLSCERSQVLVTAPDGRRYAVNGTASVVTLTLVSHERPSQG